MNQKILHIIDSGGLYGAEVMLLNLVEEQLNLGLKPTIASIGDKHIDEKPFETEALKRGFDLIKFRMLPGPNIPGAYKLLKFAQNNHFNIIHSHGYKGNILLGFIPKVFRKIPMVTTLHGYVSTEKFNKMWVYECLDQVTHKFIESIVLVNKAMLTHKKLRNKNIKKYRIVNNGIASKEISYKAVETNDQIKKFCKKGFIIGSIGRLSKEKGFNFLIEAFALLVDQGYDARLIIIGEGAERKSLETQILERGLNERVLMPGYQKNASNYLKFFDLYAITSLTEGLPITLLESMRDKIPVVATEVGGIPDVIEKEIDGIIVKPCDVGELTGTFKAIIDGKYNIKQLTKNSFEKFKNNFTSMKMALGYLEIYKEVIYQIGKK